LKKEKKKRHNIVNSKNLVEQKPNTKLNRFIKLNSTQLFFKFKLGFKKPHK